MPSLELEIQSALEEIHAKHKDNQGGKVADYIPELAKADPGAFGICVVTRDGQVFEVGDTEQQFTIQSVSKPFVYGMALQDTGRDVVQQKVDVEPTGHAFNSIIKLDEKSHRPHNPMVNAGAIATTSLLTGEGPTGKLNRLMEFFSRFVGRKLYADMSVFMSERVSGHRNRATAYLMLNFGMIDDRVEEILDLYFQQCSLLVTAKDLAIMGATLANRGVNPITRERAIEARYVQDLLSVMYTCGLYDYAGEWGYRVGMPAKSGVGGGMLAVVPQRLGIGVFSPPLDERGNSVRAIRVCQDLSTRFGLHMFDAWLNDFKVAPTVESESFPTAEMDAVKAEKLDNS